MRLVKGGKYTNDTSDLLIEIIRIYYQSDEYYKVYARLKNKRNGLVYETKAFTLYKNLITSWRHA